jgi:hypothetical protein
MVWKTKAEAEGLKRLMDVLQSQFGRDRELPVDLVRSPAGAILEVELELPGEGAEMLRQIGRAVQRAGGQLIEKGTLEAATNSSLLLPTQGAAERFSEARAAAEGLQEHLAALLQTSGADQRITRRFDVRLTVEMWAGSRYAEGIATNLSLGGMFVKTDLRPEFKSKVGVRSPLPGGQTLVATATVVHILALPKDGGLGLEFAYDPSLQTTLSRYLSTLPP